MGRSSAFKKLSSSTQKPVFIIDDEYRKTDEYKSFVRLIRDENPELPEFLCEVAITLHKNDPHLYLDKDKHDKAYKKYKAERSKEPPKREVLYENMIDITHGVSPPYDENPWFGDRTPTPCDENITCEAP